MIFGHLLLDLIKHLGGYSQERERQRHGKNVARRQQRRRYAHSDVPSLNVIEERHGIHFRELIDLLVEADPAHLGTRKSLKGREPQHVEMMQRRYRLMASTLIHRMEPPEAVNKTETLITRELWLWFGQENFHSDPEDPTDLIPSVTNWRKR